MIRTFGKPVSERGWRNNGFEWVHWRREKRRKRKLALLNGKARIMAKLTMSSQYGVLGA